MNNEKQYVRQDRQVSSTTRQKLSVALKQYNATHPRSEEWKKKQSSGIKAYWRQIPKIRHEGDGEGYIENGDVI